MPASTAGRADSGGLPAIVKFWAVLMIVIKHPRRNQTPSLMDDRDGEDGSQNQIAHPDCRCRGIVARPKSTFT